jgi:hypothetical protein
MVPLQIRAGDSITWTESPTTDNLGNEISPPDWALNCYFNNGSSDLTVSATVRNGLWKFTISAVDSADLKVGYYYYMIRATKDDEAITLASGRVEILPNIAEATKGFDGRSQARKDLEAVQAAMRSIVSGGAVKSYTIGGRSLTKMDMTDLIMLESRLKSEVVREERAQKIANGLGDPDTLKVRFK